MVYKGSGLLPPSIFITGEKGSRRGSQAFRGEQLQLRLLRMEEKYRSHFLYQQIQAFEDKVYSCYEQFNTDMLYRMFSALTKKTVVDVRKVKTMARLRKCFKDLKTSLRGRLRYRKVNATPEEEKLVAYFTWFFQYFDYLRDLMSNFTDRVYGPLFQYFYHVGYDRPDREDTNDSGISTPSFVTQRSVDSGYSAISGLTSFAADSDLPNSARILSRSVTISNSASADLEETQTERRNAVTRQALVLLGREYKDIKRLYDTSEIQTLAKRMCHLKGRIDQLMDNETGLDQEILCQDSERVVFNLKIPDQGPYNLMRLVPDVLIKFQKQAWLARRWLEKDDEKTKDLNAKLDKLNSLEEQMNTRLSSLSKEIQRKEQELESEADLLNRFLEREERSNNLNQNIFDLRERKEMLKDKMRSSIKDRNELCEKINCAMKKDDRSVARRLKPLYDRNKLQRFALERQIAALEYHLSLLESDMTVELEVKTDIIQSTNDVQDRCEEIENYIEKAKKEQKAIQAALVPISQDRQFVKEQLQIEDDWVPAGKCRPAEQAEYVGSFLHSDRMIDLNEEFIGLSTNKKAMSVFLTGKPMDNEPDYSTPRTGKKKPDKPSHDPTLKVSKQSHAKPSKIPIKSYDQGHVTPIEKPMKHLSLTGARKQPIPNLVPSEW